MVSTFSILESTWKKKQKLKKNVSNNVGTTSVKLPDRRNSSIQKNVPKTLKHIAKKKKKKNKKKPI